jgi:arginase
VSERSTDVILLPYHHDDRLSDRSISVPASMNPIVVDPALPERGQWMRLASLYDSLADQVAQGIADGPLKVVTGDCLATVGTLVGLQRAGLDPLIVWFDAHGDVHTSESSESGYHGGLSLRIALGGDFALLGEPLGLQSVAEDRAVLVDARDLDPAEERYLTNSRLTHASVEDVSLELLPDGPVLLHVDVDVVDAQEVPGLRFPAANGPTAAQVVEAVQRLVSTGRVVALDLAFTWFEPSSADDLERRAELVASLLRVDLP